jgi:hypothetical protein
LPRLRIPPAAKVTGILLKVLKSKMEKCVSENKFKIDGEEPQKERHL